jgi:thiamine-monophosphate kinase
MPFASAEQQLIEFIKQEAGNQYIGDDCAILSGGLLVSCDAIVEGVHFLLPDHSLEDIGFKSLAVNLSDIAAMAGIPQFVVVSISAPADFSIYSLKRLFKAMHQFADKYRVKIVGGDITRASKLHLNVTVLGKENTNGSWLRSAARTGDVVIATGDFGAAAAGLWSLLQNLRSYRYCLTKHRRPEPRIKEALQLAAVTQSKGALIDASDGLADALVQISAASNVGMEIKEDLIPMHEEMRKAAKEARVDPLHWALYGGEDYELVGCVSAADWDLLSKATPRNFKKIGAVSSAPGVFVEKSTGERHALDMSQTFQHLKADG